MDSLYEESSEWFNLGDFTDVDEQLAPDELPVFLKAAEAPNDVDWRSIKDYDCFQGLRAVIHHRLDQYSPEQLRRAAELFNWTIYCGLCCCDTESWSEIEFGHTKVVAPLVVQRVLNQLLDDTVRAKETFQITPSAVEQTFLPLLPLLKMLNETLQSAEWVQNQLALGIFFWVAEKYRAALEEDYGYRLF